MMGERTFYVRLYPNGLGDDPTESPFITVSEKEYNLSPGVEGIRIKVVIPPKAQAIIY